MVRHHAKFNSSSYNGFSVEIAAMKNFRALGATPLRDIGV